MSFPPGVPGGLYATSVVQPVQQQPMMVQVAPVRHVMLPASSVVMRPVVASPIHTIAAPPRPQIIQTFSPMQQQAAVHAVQQQAVAQLTKKAEEAASNAAQNPPITVFVSNITDRASDTLVRQMLMKCGSVFAWKRVQGASGKLQAFGFCEYKEPESALRAIHLLHDFELGDKKLRVKVDAKTQDILNKWKETNGIKGGGKDALPPNIGEAKSGLDLLMKEYAAELNSALPVEQTDAKSSVHKIEEPVVRESHNVEENLKELDLEDSEKDYISKEIRTFRTTQKQREEEKKREDEIKKKIERERKEEDRQREKSRQKEREDRDRDEREKSRKDERNRTPLKHWGSSRHSRSPPPRGGIRRSRTPPRLSRTRTPPRRRSRSRSIHGSSRIRRSRSRSPRRRDDDNEDDETYERRRMERKIREKEQAYQERLRTWEMRERRKKRDYEKRDDRESQIRKEMMREAKRLQEFLADYDDLKMDPKYYTGGALAKRKREWNREREFDAKDRKKEQEEIEALRQKLVEENHPDPETAIAKAVKETENVWQPLLKPDTPPPVKQQSPKKGNSSSSSSSSGSDSESDHEGKSASASSESEDESEDKSPGPRLVTANLIPVQEQPEAAAVTVASIMSESKKEMVNSFEPVAENGNESGDDDDDDSDGVIRTEIVEQQEDSPGNFENQLLQDGNSQSSTSRNEPVMQLPGSNQRRKLKVSDVFNQDDDEEEVPKKRKLVPIEYTNEEQNAMRSQEDKRKMVRALIEKIPTKKEDLFDYNLDWSMIDANLMEKRIQPWITKKIVEYIGEEEPTLVEFICSKILSKSPPERIYGDVSMVLDDEAEVFVVKMWRLLIYETEAKKEGLSK